jgi:enoyl-CoA hydratase/carnithine racemase
VPTMQGSMGDFVRLEVDDGVGVVRVDRPPANALDHQTGLELQDAFRAAAERDDVGAVVIWGGPKIFAAGADIKAMAEFDPEQVRPVVGALGDALDLLEAMPKVSIAAINGYALGGGFELALAADLRYLADDGKVGQPEILLGVIPGAGGTQRLAHLVGPGRARDLVYTGRRVAAQEALDLGLVERVLPSGDVLAAAVADARGFAHGPREALGAAKEAIRAALLTPGPGGLARENELFRALFGTPDQREGMRAFLEKREPRFGDDRS